MQKKVNSPNILILVISGVSLFIGFYACVLIKKFTKLSINDQVAIEINPLEVISLGVSVALAIYVTRILSRKNDLEKNEKGLLISSLSDFKELLNSKVSKIIESNDFESANTKSDLKILRQRINSITSLAKEYEFVEENEVLATELKETVRDIWEYITDFPKEAKPESSEDIKEIANEKKVAHIQKIESALIKFESLSFKLSIKINKK